MVFVLVAIELRFFLLLLSALWWRGPGLCKLPDGRDCGGEKLGLALVGRVLLRSNYLLMDGVALFA